MFKEIIYLSDADYQTLLSTGTLTKNGQTITYDPDNLYLTPGAEEYVTLTTDQTISGEKTFSNDIVLSQNGSWYTPAIWFGKNKANFSSYQGGGGTGGYIFTFGYGTGSSLPSGSLLRFSTQGNFVLYAQGGSGNTLGNSTYPWQDLYLSGSVKFGNIGEISVDTSNVIIGNSVNSIVVGPYSTRFAQDILPVSNTNRNIGSSTSNYNWQNGYFSGQVYAQNTFNVINATDITNNTLTQAQYDLITNGKPTLIKGTYLGYNNMIIVGWFQYSTSWRAMAFAENKLFSMLLNTTTLSLAEGGRDIVLNKIASFNSKQIPEYPTTNTSPQVLTIGASGGSLSWQDHANEWYGTQAEYDNLSSYDSNTLYYIEEE